MQRRRPSRPPANNLPPTTNKFACSGGDPAGRPPEHSRLSLISLCIVATGRFYAILRNLFPLTRRILKRNRAAEGQIGRFRKNSSFLFPFAPVLQPVIGRKREQKSGNGRKTPKWQKKMAGKPKFSCPPGVQIFEKQLKMPTDSAAHKLLEADQLKNAQPSPRPAKNHHRAPAESQIRRRGPHITISQAPQPTSYLLSLSMNCSEKIASSAYTTVCMISAVQLRTRLCKSWS